MHPHPYNTSQRVGASSYPYTPAAGGGHAGGGQAVNSRKLSVPLADYVQPFQETQFANRTQLVDHIRNLCRCRGSKNKSDVTDSILLRLNSLFESSSNMPLLMRTNLAEAAINLAIGSLDGEVIIEGTDPLLWGGVLHAHSPDQQLPKDLQHLLALKLGKPLSNETLIFSEQVNFSIATEFVNSHINSNTALHLPLTSYNDGGEPHHTIVKFTPVTATSEHAHTLGLSPGQPIWQVQHYDTNASSVQGRRHQVKNYLLPSNASCVDAAYSILQASGSYVFRAGDMFTIQQLPPAEGNPFASFVEQGVDDYGEGQTLNSCTIGSALFAMLGRKPFEGVPVLNGDARPQSSVSSSAPVADFPQLGVSFRTHTERYIDMRSETPRDVVQTTSSIHHLANEQIMAHRPLIQDYRDPNRPHAAIPQPHKIQPYQRNSGPLSMYSKTLFGKDTKEGRAFALRVLNKVDDYLENPEKRAESELKYFRVVDSIHSSQQPLSLGPRHATTGIRGVVAKEDIPPGTPLLVAMQLLNTQQWSEWRTGLAQGFQQHIGVTADQAMDDASYFRDSYTWGNITYRSSQGGKFKVTNMAGAGNVSALVNADKTYLNMKVIGLATFAKELSVQGTPIKSVDLICYVNPDCIPENQQCVTSYGNNYDFGYSPPKMTTLVNSDVAPQLMDSQFRNEYSYRRAIKQEVGSGSSQSVGATSTEHQTTDSAAEIAEKQHTQKWLNDKAKYQLPPDEVPMIRNIMQEIISIRQNNTNKYRYSFQSMLAHFACQYGRTAEEIFTAIQAYGKVHPNDELMCAFRKEISYLKLTRQQQLEDTFNVLLRILRNQSVNALDLILQERGIAYVTMNDRVCALKTELPEGDPTIRLYEYYKGYRHGGLLAMNGAKSPHDNSTREAIRRAIPITKPEKRVALLKKIAEEFGITYKVLFARISRYLTRFPDSELCQSYALKKK